MNAARRDTIGLAIAVAVLAAIAVGQHRLQSRVQPSTFSSYDTGRDGYRALYAVLASAGVPVLRLQRPLPTLAHGGTLILSDNRADPAHIAFDRADSAALLRFVSGGGRLVVLAANFDGKRDVVPRVPETSQATVSVATASLALRAQAGVRSVDAPAESAFSAGSPATAVLLDGARRRVAIAYRIGKGTVIASTSPASFGNARLLERDNLRFAYAVLAGHGPVIFDEYAHGFDDDATFWDAVPDSIRLALAIAVAIVLVALLGANVPFAPPVRLDAPDERTSAAYVDAMASLLRRARSRSDVAAALIANARRASPSPQRDAVLHELDRLFASKPNDAALRRGASLEYQLRKERL